MYLLCCILRIVKIKDMANTVAAALFCPIDAFVPSSEAKLNGYKSDHDKNEETNSTNLINSEVDSRSLQISIPSSSSQIQSGDGFLRHNLKGSHLALR